MFSQYFQTLQNCLKVKELQSRIFFTLMLLVVCRVVAMTPIPGLDGQLLLSFFDQLREQQGSGTEGGAGLLGMYSMFTGGALERCAVGSLGIMPYISATIIIQLMTAVVPSLSKLAPGRRWSNPDHQVRSLPHGVALLGARVCDVGRLGKSTKHDLASVSLMVNWLPIPVCGTAFVQ